MSPLIRASVLVLLAGCAGSAAAQAPPNTAGEARLDAAVQRRVEQRYRVLLIRDGVVLTPRRGSAQSIEIAGGAIAIDGATVSGGELRERLGDDADLVLQLSYATPEALRAAFGPPAPPEPPAAPVPPVPVAPAEDATPPAPPAVPEPPEPQRWERTSGSRVRFGGDIVIDEQERVTEPVVAIGGSVTVNGRVDDDVVAIGGRIKVGPHGYIAGGATSVGGYIERAAGGQIRGEVNEIGVGTPDFHFAGPHLFRDWGRDLFSGWFRLFGTIMRIAIVLLVALVIALAAARPVERIGRRAGDDPWLSGFVGLLAQVFFVPILVVTIVVLAISIIGIPLLLLVPFALIALLIGVVVGFTGVAYRVGRWAAGPEKPLLVAVAVGVVVLASVALVARVLWLVPGPIAPIALVVSILGFFVEYLAWTVGLGSLILTRFGTRGPGDAVMPGYTAPIVPPPVPQGPQTLGDVG